MTPSGPAQLLVFAFESAEGRFEGRLGGALERAESGGALRILRALFVGRDAATGELSGTDLRGGAGGLVAPLLSFRLDPGRRRAATAKALEPDVNAAAPELLEKLGAVLEPGQAIVAVLVEHVWTAALADAVARSGGHPLTDDFVRLGDAADFDRRVLEFSSRSGRGPAAPAGPDR